MPKKGKKPKKKTKSKPKKPVKTKKIIVKKIPAKVGASARNANVTQVVAQGTGTGGVGSRGGAGSYANRRSQGQLAQDRERQARAILGIPEGQRIQMTGRGGQGRRQETTKPSSITQPQGGFTGGVQGFGIRETKENKSDNKLEKRIVQMGDRIANLEERENDAVRNNENQANQNEPRIDAQGEAKTAEQILRDFKPEADRIIGRQQALRQSQARARRGARHANHAREYTPIQTDAERDRDRQIDTDRRGEAAEKRQKEQSEKQANIDKIKAKRAGMIAEGKREEAIDNVKSILGNIVEGSMESSERNKEQQRVQKEKDLKGNVLLRETQLQTRQAQQERARAIEQKKELDKEAQRVEAKQRASQIMADAIKERQDEIKEQGRQATKIQSAIRGVQGRQKVREKIVERAVGEVMTEASTRQGTGATSDPIILNEESSSDEDDFESEIDATPKVVQDVDDLINIGQTTLTPQVDINTDDEFESADEFEEVSFEDAQEKPTLPPRPNARAIRREARAKALFRPLNELAPEERPLPTPPDKPIPALNQSTQTSTETSSRESNTDIDPQAFVEINRLRNMTAEPARPLPERPLPVPPPMPDIDESGIRLKRLKEAELNKKRIQQQAVEKRRDARESQIRGQTRADRDRTKRNQKLMEADLQQSILNSLIDKSISTSESNLLGQPRAKGQGRKPLDADTELRNFRVKNSTSKTPREFEDALNEKDVLQNQLKELIDRYYNAGFNGRYFDFNIRDFQRITSQGNDQNMLRDLGARVRASPLSDIAGQFEDIMRDMKEVIKLKQLIKQKQNIIKRFK